MHCTSACFLKKVKKKSTRWACLAGPGWASALSASHHDVGNFPRTTIVYAVGVATQVSADRDCSPGTLSDKPYWNSAMMHWQTRLAGVLWLLQIADGSPC